MSLLRNFVCNRLAFLRERGWAPISAQDYETAWHRFGGSVATHPQIVSSLSELAEVQVRYLGWYAGDELQAAIPTWGRFLALSKEWLKRHGKRGLFDLGNSEVILPLAPEAADIRLHHRVAWLSELHAEQITSLRLQQEQLMLARTPEDYSKKFLYNQRRERRLLEEAGGEILPVLSLPADEIAAIYTELFEKRWQFPVPGKAYLPQVFGLLRPFMSGHLICIKGRPATIQILYQTESPGWLSAEYVNGGVDPEFNALSPGSVLTFVNTQAAWQQARELGKALRYSFGRADRGYKERWCQPLSVFKTG